MFNGGDFNVAAGATLNVIGQLAGATTFAKTNDGNMTIDRSPTYTGTTTVNGGRLALNGSLTTSTSVTVGNAGVFEMAHSAGFNNVINVPAVTIGANARIDLKNNKLFTASPIGTWNGTAYTGVQGDVQRAYDFGSWDLPGLMTSENDAGPTVGTTTIAVSDGASILFLGATETGMFAGQSVTGATTIAVYTYAGDVNFDGLVDASDYGIIDNYFQFPGTTGYANGDFNYDGVIDAGDYGIIDNTFQLQGAPIPMTGGVAGASLSGVTAVPEPASLSVIGLAAAVLMGRRQRRSRHERDRSGAQQ
jgi:autotransporter-associated beta strand protein